MSDGPVERYSQAAWLRTPRRCDRRPTRTTSGSPGVWRISSIVNWGRPDRSTLSSRKSPPDHECDRRGDREHDEEYRRFLGDRIPSLGNTDPHIDARADEPQPNED